MLQDHKEHSPKAIGIIEKQNVYIKNEVLAEVVYVLNKTYKVDKLKLKEVLIYFIGRENVYFESKKIATLALDIFTNQNIDFVDALLCSYKKIRNLKIVSFDKRLNKCLESNLN